MNSFPASGDFYRLLITFENSFTQMKVIWIQTVWHSDGILKDFFEKVNLKKKNPQMTKKDAKLPSMQRV